MKKLLSLILVFAMAMSMLVSVAPVFAVENDTVSVGDVFAPENLGTSVNNGQYKLGWFKCSAVNSNSSVDYTKKSYYDTVTSGAYTDSTNSYATPASATSSTAIKFTLDYKYAMPFIEFIAPASGTYSFSMSISNDWSSGSSQSSQIKFVSCSVDTSTGTKTDVGSAITIPKTGSTNGTTEVTLSKGESVFFTFDTNTVKWIETWPFTISNLKATVTALTPDTVSVGDVFAPENIGTVNNGKYKFGYASATVTNKKNVYDITTRYYFDGVGEKTTGFIYASSFAGGGLYPYTYSGDTTKVNVAGFGEEDRIILMPNGKNHYVAFVEFTAPVNGTYTISATVSMVDWIVGDLGSNSYVVRAYTVKNGTTSELTGYTPASAKVKFSEGGALLSYSVELKQGESVILIPDCNKDYLEDYPLLMEGLKATVTALTPEGCQHGGEFTYGKDGDEHWKICSECDEEIENTRASHDGGTATCTAQKECTTCGQSYGDTLSHTPKTTYETNGTQHWKICQNCPTVIDGTLENHTPKTAYEHNTENHWKICDDCDAEIDGTRADHVFVSGVCECGELEPVCDHAANGCAKTYSNKTETGHVATWSCGAVDTSDVSHTYADGICSKCNYSHQNHTGGTATCTDKAECEICHTTYGEVLDHEPKAEYGKDEDGHWQICKNGCNSEIAGSAATHTYVDGACSVCDYEHTNHTGGTATCTDKAECETCGKSYGETLEHEPKVGEYGKNEEQHWQICGNGCNDKIAGTETAHDFSNGDCICGQKKPATSANIGDKFTPTNLGTSVNNGYFKLGWFNSSQENSMAKINYWGKHYFDTVSNGEYSDSTDTSEPYVKAEAANKLLLKVHMAKSTPFIEFTAPESGKYTFTMSLVNNWGSGSGVVRMTPCTVSDGVRTVLGTAGVFGAYGDTVNYTVIIELEKGKSVIFLLDPADAKHVEDWPYTITDLTATFTAYTTGDVEVGTVMTPENLGTSVNNGQFKLGWFNSKQENSMATINYWGKHYFDTVTGGEYSDSKDTSEPYVKAEAANKLLLKVHMAKSTPFIEFTAPVAGTYTFSMNLVNNWGSGSGVVRITPCSVNEGVRTVRGDAGVFGAHGGSVDYTVSIKLKKGESIIFLLDPADAKFVEDWPYTISGLSATLVKSSAQTSDNNMISVSIAFITMAVIGLGYLGKKRKER